jgi:hypothetical protein
MADLITTILNTAVEHAPSTATVVAIYKTARPFLEKILGPPAEELGELNRDHIKGRRAKNAERTLADADKLLAATGREPQEVPLNIVVPLLDQASLQEEPSLAEKWAALLANAADPGSPVKVQPGFIDVLRQLEPVDTIILNKLYLGTEGELIDEKDVLNTYLIDTEVFNELATFNELNYYKARASFDNIIRLRLCSEAEAVLQLPPAISGFKRSATAFGFGFMQACMAPRVDSLTNEVHPT